MKKEADALKGSDFWALCRQAGMTYGDYKNCGLLGFSTGLERLAALIALRRALKAGNLSRCLDVFADDPCADIRDFTARINAAVTEGC